MREGSANRRAAWHEMWPTSVFALVLALVTVWVMDARRLPGSPWLVLVLVPAALYAGTTAGRSTSRMLAFLLARPCRRERVLSARVWIALGALVIAWTIATASILARDPDVRVLVEASLGGGLLALALACGVVGSTATDREPLALGIGTLLFASIPSLLLIQAEALDITLARVFAVHPLGIGIAVAIGVLALGGVVRAAWRERLPLRDPPMVRALVTGCAGAWLLAELPCAVLVWQSAAADAGVPMVVLGTDDGALVVASGSPTSLGDVTGPRVDSIHVGIEVADVALDATRRHALFGDALFGDVTRATTMRGHVAATIARDGDGVCRVVAGEVGQPLRELDVACGRLSLSPSGESLAIESERGLELVDVASAQVRSIAPPRYTVLGWRGEEPVSRGRLADEQGAPGRGRDEIRVGAAVVSTLPAVHVRLSPDGRRLALALDVGEVPSAQVRLDTPSTMFAIVTLRDGTTTRLHRGGSDGVRLVDWLDSDHVVIVERPGLLDASLSVLAIDSGVLVASVPLAHGLPVAHLDGPASGPWLVTRAGGLIEAWASDGEVVWHEEVATLDRDDRDVRRWAIVAGEVVGIDRRGRWWRHEVPWEVTP